MWGSSKWGAWNKNLPLLLLLQGRWGGGLSRPLHTAQCRLGSCPLPAQVRVMPGGRHTPTCTRVVAASAAGASTVSLSEQTKSWKPVISFAREGNWSLPSVPWLSSQSGALPSERSCAFQYSVLFTDLYTGIAVPALLLAPFWREHDWSKMTGALVSEQRVLWRSCNAVVFEDKVSKRTCKWLSCIWPEVCLVQQSVSERNWRRADLLLLQCTWILSSQRQSYGKHSEYLANSGYCLDILGKVNYIR